MITNGYATVQELQEHIDPSGAASFSAGDRELMETAIEAASRWIDHVTGTRFYTVSETRVYQAEWHDLLYIDDLVSLTSLKTDDDDDGVYEVTWQATDYMLEPRNAALGGRPYRQIRTRRNGEYSFPRNETVQVTGAFGYSSTVPAVVKQACLLIAHRLWRRKDAIFGVSGTPGLGVTVVQARITADNDVMALLSALDVAIVGPSAGQVM